MEPLEAHDPETIGRYRLRGRLGAGGMGQVYLGADDAGALVAIKVVHPGLAHDTQFRARFRREVEACRRVSGPWVAALIDADPEAATPWLATEYVPGPSLAAAVTARGPLPAATVHVLAHGLALALNAIHDAGLVHRDVKPSNVLLDDDHPRLIDFGISRAADGTRMTSTGVVVGTPAFMSPEQITGTEVGPPSDVFSLGSVLVYAVTGRSPFGDVAPVVLMMRISHHEPDLDGVPEVLRAPIRACLAKRPEDRPTAAELGSLLGSSAVGGQGWPPAAPAAVVTPAPPAGVEPPAAAPTDVALPATRVDPDPDPDSHRRTSRRALLGVGAALGLATAGALIGLAAAPPRPRQAGEPFVRWTFQGDGIARGLALGDGVVYATGLDGHVHALDQRTGEPRWSYPLRDSPAMGGLPGAKGGSGEVAVDGPTVAVSSGQSIIGLDAGSGTPRWESPGMVMFGAGGGIVLGASGTSTEDITLHALDPQTGDPRWDVVVPEPRRALLTGGSGRLVVAAVRDVRTYEAQTGKELWRRKADEDVLEVGADAGVIYYVTDFGQSGGFVVVVDAATGAERWRRTNDRGADAVSAATISGGTMFLCGVARLEARDLATGDVVWIGHQFRGDPRPELITTPLETTADTCYFGGTHYFTDDRGQHTSEARVAAADLTTGELLWTLPTEPTPPPGAGTPLVAVPGTVFVGGTGADRAVSER
jgi:outer membrane protein assembly factor BamB